MRNRLIVGAAVACALAVGVVAGRWDSGGSSRDLVVTPVMPCGSDEVYVWEDYPDEARCVSSTDHAAHAGHHG